MSTACKRTGLLSRWIHIVCWERTRIAFAEGNPAEVCDAATKYMGKGDPDIIYLEFKKKKLLTIKGYYRN